MIKIMKLCCCSNILVKGITIITPISSPNTGWHQPRFLHQYENRRLLHSIRNAYKTTSNPAAHMHFSLQRHHRIRKRNVQRDPRCPSRRHRGHPY
ncbi:hypothetical protein PS2_040437 [Malus domestica]